jgi:hypothetical protein
LSGRVIRFTALISSLARPASFASRPRPPARWSRWPRPD